MHTTRRSISPAATRCLAVCLAVLCALSTLVACRKEAAAYTPTGEFYAKTSPSRGDGGAVDVISLEAEHLSYYGEGDITVPMTVGLGHLPQHGDHSDQEERFYALYSVVAFPQEPDAPPVWEKKVEYSDPWYHDTYDSTEQENHPFLFFPHYGEFYPLYREQVEIVFPAEAAGGRLYVRLYRVMEGYEDCQFAQLDISFTRTDGVLTLAP